MTEAMKKVCAEPCLCVTCTYCNGTGYIRYTPLDQFNDETEPCDSCSGGVSEVCDRCQLLTEMEHDAS